jgi:hypothetical protein
MWQSILSSYQIMTALVPIVELDKFRREVEGSAKLKSQPYCYWNITVTEIGKELPHLLDLFNSISEGVYYIEGIFQLYNRLKGIEQQRLADAIINLYFQLKSFPDAVVIFAEFEDLELPSAFKQLIPLWQLPLPTMEAIQEILRPYWTTHQLPHLIECSRSLSGLYKSEIESILPMLHHHRDRLTRFCYDYRVTRLKFSGLDFLEVPELAEFGGLELLRMALDALTVDFSAVAKEYNIPLPKGWLLVGPPGTGKTHSARVIASKLGFPLVSISADVVASNGPSYLRRLLNRIEACSPCVAYFDELDKYFGKDNSSPVLAVLLTWLQDKKTPTFVLATLNRIENVPPELMRPGRFNRIFGIGFPSNGERFDIFRLFLRKYDVRYKDSEFGSLTQNEWNSIIKLTVNCTGAEIEEIVERSARMVLYEISNNTPERINSPPIVTGSIAIDYDTILKARKTLKSLFERDTNRILGMFNAMGVHAEPSSLPDRSIFALEERDLWGEKIS